MSSTHETLCAPVGTMRPLLCIAALLNCAFLAYGQDTSILFGQVVDPSGSAIPEAKLVLTDATHGLVRNASSGSDGIFVFDRVPAGTYKLEVEREGFSRLTMESVVILSRNRQSLHIELQLAAIANSVTVSDTTEGVASDSGTGTSVDQDYLRHLPVNGRSIDTLMQTAPGVVSSAGPGMNVNGLRASMNYYTVDGVSLGSGMMMGGPMMGGPGGPGAGGGGGGGVGPGAGGMSLDSLAELNVQTSTYAAEFGRTPGAQVAMVSRGGSNQFHGDVFSYNGRDNMNASDWFANRYGLPRGDMSLNQYGGGLGGPVIKDRTYFYVNYERQNSTLPTTTLVNVPSAATRASAPAVLKPYLAVYPVANGALLEDGAAQFSGQFTSPIHGQSASLRLDHTFNPTMTGFLRYGWSKNDGTGRGEDMTTPNVVHNMTGTQQSLVGALTQMIRPNVSNDLRVSFSAGSSTSNSWMDSFGGGSPLSASTVFPAGVTTANGAYSFSVMGVSGYSFSPKLTNHQYSMNAVDGLSMLAGKHQYKMGVDVRISAARNQMMPYSQSVSFNGLGTTTDTYFWGALFSLVPNFYNVSSSAGSTYPYVTNFSAYIQDTFKLLPRTTVTYGIRWDVNPAPMAWKGQKPFAISSVSSERVTQNEPLFDTRWTDMAPRMGVSHQLRTKPGQETVIHAGFGAYHDTSVGSALMAFSGAPYVASYMETLPDFPLSSDLIAPRSLPARTPYGVVNAAQRNLQSPLVYQFSIGVQRNFGRSQIANIKYAGSRGSRLLISDRTPTFSNYYQVLSKATNDASSQYNAMQVQYVRRLSTRLSTQVAYTWAKSIDDSSGEGMMGFATMSGGRRGPSDFDIRHLLNWSGNFNLPAPKLPGVGLILRDWAIDWMATARTSTPFDIMGTSQLTSNGEDLTDIMESGRDRKTYQSMFSRVRPNYIGGHVWRRDISVPGGKRLNRDAFEMPDTYTQGNLGRNSLRGFGLAQLDLSIRRQINVAERYKLNLVGQAFNITNSPAFANPRSMESGDYNSANFGVATRILSSGVAGYSHAGGPRSIQVSLRLQF